MNVAYKWFLNQDTFQGIGVGIIFFIALSLFGCEAEGDIYPEINSIYVAVEQDKDFVIDTMFNNGLRDIEIWGKYLFVYYPNYTYDEDSSKEVHSLTCEVFKDGKEHYLYELSKDRIYNPLEKDKSGNVYLGNTVIYPPNYDSHEELPVISPEDKQQSLSILESIVSSDQVYFSSKHYSLLEGVESFDDTDSLKNVLMYDYRNDSNQEDSSYRELLFFFLFNADSYIWTKNYTIVNFGDKKFFWDSYNESNGRYKTFRNIMFRNDKMENSSFGASTNSLFGKTKYSNPQTLIDVNRFDKSIEEWDVHAIGAPHVGGIFFPDAAKIWYYEVQKNEETILQFKVRERDNDELEPFNYCTNQNEFYLYELYKGKLLRVKYVGEGL